MPEQLPFLSVIIPVYNAERHLAAAIKSIQDQQYPALEILAIDDGSSDKSAEILRSFPEVTYTYQTNQGPAAARNRGIQQAKGEFILFLDADDYFPAGKIQQQLAYFERDPTLEAVVGKSQFIFEEDAQTDEFRFPDETHQVFNVLVGSGIYRRSVFEKIGLFDEGLRFSEDFDWFNRIREKEVAMLLTDDITLFYRRHNTNMTRDTDSMRVNALLMIKRSLDRRRQEGEMRELPKFSELKA
ncbi:glycosyltransferase family 2 protein [Tellurirhabdus bombi]|uniref:glycosyltransferase family 2 protein n=1 Tax=Tellurirhabdus bombi TaxID=2907205 RepID=UPI001F48344F|nr:glycosyltransferase family A protein [Tellurirhabdus bombi]